VSPAVGRTLTILAIAFLAFDGTALVALGLMMDRMLLVPVGLVFFLSSVLIVVYWRWHRRKLEDIRAARRILSEEARELQRLMRESVDRREKGER
jgi:hypothetical protein